MNIKDAKSRVQKEIVDVEQDIQMLQNNIAKIKDLIKTLPDEVDEDYLNQIEEMYDAEKGLKHIVIF